MLKLFLLLCLGSLEIRKIGISFIIGYVPQNQLKKMPYVQTTTLQIHRRTKSESSFDSRPGWSSSFSGMRGTGDTFKSVLRVAKTSLFRIAPSFFQRDFVKSEVFSAKLTV